MPDEPTLPPNKMVNKIVTEITKKIWNKSDINERSDIRRDKQITILIREIAELRARIENIEKKN